MQPARRRGFEAEARVVVGVAEHEHDRVTRGAAGVETGAHQRGTDPFALARGIDRHRCEALRDERAALALHAHGAEQDVADDAPVAFRHQRDRRGAGGAQRVHQLRLAELRKRARMDFENGALVSRLLGADHESRGLAHGVIS